MKKLALMIAAGALVGMLNPAYAAGDAAAGAAKAAGCGGCHGANGEGLGPNPKLAGLAPDAFIKAMQDYKSGARASAAMQAMVMSLNDQDFADLAAFYATK